MVERFHKLVKALFFYPTPTNDKAPSSEGAFLVYPHPRDRMELGFFFGNTEISLELWNVIAGISGFDE